MFAEARSASERFAAEENCGVEWSRIWSIEPVPFHPALIDLCDEAVKETAGKSHRLPSGPLHDAQAGTRVWGQLPPKEREKILQSQTEGFPAGYESVLANYYSRLAQEQVAGENAIGPTTQPVAP